MQCCMLVAKSVPPADTSKKGPNKMSNFTVAVITTMYALICLMKESDPAMYLWTTSSGKCIQKKAAGKLELKTPGKPKISGTKSNHE